MCGATIPDPNSRVERTAAPASWPLWSALLVTFLITAVRMTGTVDSDVAWQLWIAGRIHAGANLYRDIVETNPPLWFWMALPIDRLAHLLDARPEAILAAAGGLVVALSLTATDRLITHIEAPRRALLLGYGAMALLAASWAHLGQREQIVLIGAIPYAALVAARREATPVPVSLAALIGIGAALGFALKQYFLLVPLTLELWLVAGLRRGWRPVRPETLALVAAGLTYAAALIVLEPDFLTRIVPLLGIAYGVFGAPGIGFMFGPFAIAGLLILGFVLGHARLLAGRKAPLAEALLVAALAFAAIYFIQFKGWVYHSIPLVGCASLSLAALLAERRSPPLSLRLAAPVFLSFPLILAAEEQLHPTLPTPDMRAALSGLRPGDTIGFLTTETAVPWSVTLQGGYRYASRYNGFWMMRAIVRNEHSRNPDPRLTALGRQITAETIADFSCTPPRRILVSRPRPGEDGFDILPFFMRDSRFAAMLGHYRVRSRTSLETYELAFPLPPPGHSCRSGI